MIPEMSRMNSSQRQIALEAQFPTEVHIITHIFLFVCDDSPKDFSAFSLVSKRWRAIAEDFIEDQRKAPEVCGKADFIEYTGGDPGDEPLIPKEYLFWLKRGRTFLLLVPKSLKFTQPDGTVVEEPRTRVNMGKWFSNANGANKIGMRSSRSRFIPDESPTEENHWVFIDLTVIEKNKSFEDQVEAVNKRKAQLVRLSDLCLCLFMVFVKTGVRHLDYDLKTWKGEWSRVGERTVQGAGLAVSFPQEGLTIGAHVEEPISIIGVVIERKIFGH